MLILVFLWKISKICIWESFPFVCYLHFTCIIIKYPLRNARHWLKKFGLRVYKGKRVRIMLSLLCSCHVNVQCCSVFVQALQYYSEALPCANPVQITSKNVRQNAHY